MEKYECLRCSKYWAEHDMATDVLCVSCYDSINLVCDECGEAIEIPDGCVPSGDEIVYCEECQSNMDVDDMELL